MRPRFALILMLITLAFLLVLMMSPGFWHRKALDHAAVLRFQNPTPENIQALQVEQGRARRSQYFVCSLVVMNFVAIIVYGEVQHKKRFV